MQPLDKDLRSQLEKAVKDARDIAETGAKAALNRIGVGDKKKPDFLNDEQAELRVQLRARGRQLGDTLHNSGAQDIEHLVREMAYEHWHRMLFARYLAANNLLMHPELNVPVTLGDCEELADEEGARDGFALAARYATDMLPQIFREDDPVLEVEMAPEHRNKLQRKVEGLPQRGVRGRRQPGVGLPVLAGEAQGRGERLGRQDRGRRAARRHAALHRALHGAVSPRQHARRVVDGAAPRYGSLLRVPALRGGSRCRARDRRGDRRAGAGRGNVRRLAGRGGRPHGDGPLHGIGPLPRGRPADAGPACGFAKRGSRRNTPWMRCCATTCTGWRLTSGARRSRPLRWRWRRGRFPAPRGYRELPEMNLACSGLAPEGDLRAWEKLAGDDERLRNGMRRLYTLFQDAPTLGSLIDPGAPENRLVHGDL